VGIFIGAIAAGVLMMAFRYRHSWRKLCVRSRDSPLINHAEDGEGENDSTTAQEGDFEMVNLTSHEAFI